MSEYNNGSRSILLFGVKSDAITRVLFCVLPFAMTCNSCITMLVLGIQDKYE